MAKINFYGTEVEVDYSGYTPTKDIEKKFNEIIKNNQLKPLILIEGTDCSGKETQSKLLIENLKTLGHEAKYFSYPNYKTPTGYIIGASYLGKPHMGPSIFTEGIENVDAKVAGQLFAINRFEDKANLAKALTENIVVLDRYVESNMAYQGGLQDTPEERNALFDYFHNLEYGLNNLLQPVCRILIVMPYEYICLLRETRAEKFDEMEKSEYRMRKAQQAYMELAKRYNFFCVNCVKPNADYSNPKRTDIKTPEEISKEIFEYVKSTMFNNEG